MESIERRKERQGKLLLRKGACADRESRRAVAVRKGGKRGKREGV